MSTKYPGGIITKNYTAPTPTSASGIWTLEQQEQAQQAGIWPYGGPFNYIEDVFSTYLYTGTNATQTITNNIDLSTKGGLVWMKNRATDSTYGGSHQLVDTVRGLTTASGSSMLSTNNTDPASGAQTDGAASRQGFSSFNADGFTLRSVAATVYSGSCNTSGVTYGSWTFRKQPKFFDVVTWTGNGSNPRTISHNLGSTPGCIIVKETNASGSWAVWQRSLGDGYRLILNSTNASTNVSAVDWFGTSNSTITSTGFSVGNNLNTSGRTLVAYLFAHDAGGFGLTGTDNVISCGSYSGNDSTVSVNLGYEAQWVLIKATGTATNWYIFDNMRGMAVTGQTVSLKPNLSSAEADTGQKCRATATGFVAEGDITLSGSDYIYIAIRRGPMKVPTDGTTVFMPITSSGTTGTTLTTNFPIDAQLEGQRTNTDSQNWSFFDRLRGVSSTTTEVIVRLTTSNTNAEASTGAQTLNWNNTGFQVPSYNGASSISSIYYNFRRAPGFFDEVCYTGTGANASFNHNLGVAPELMILKKRGAAGSWTVYQKDLGNTSILTLNSTAAVTTGATTSWNSTSPTSTQFTVGTSGNTNPSAVTMVAYLFATCAGVSKVGSYTGTGSLLTINCGFTGGARFVLIKRTNAVAYWYVWDTARGMVAGTDPWLLLNTTDAETNADTVYTTTGGFQIVASPSGDVNTNGGTYIYLAIA